MLITVCGHTVRAILWGWGSMNRPSTQFSESRVDYNILRCFMSGNVTLLVRAFVVYVRPVL